MTDLKLLTLPPSPNNGKVRVALGFKGLDYEDLPQDPQDRSTLIELSGQALTPVLQHGDTVLFDSAAILRYLHANFPGPALFPADYDQMKKVEQWEAFARFGVRESFGPMYAMTFGRAEREPAAIAATMAAIERDLESVERRLAEHDWLVGDALSAADITLASLLVYQVGLSHPVFERLPLLAFIPEHFSLPADSYPAIHAWVRRVVAYDRFWAAQL